MWCLEMSRIQAFGKLWHQDPQYKTIRLNLPTPITKFMNFIKKIERPEIKIRNFVAALLALAAGVPQGSATSPTLYTIFTTDIPEPAIDCKNYYYTQTM